MLLGRPFRYLFLVIYQWHLEKNPVRKPAILPAVLVTTLLSLNILAGIEVFRFFVNLPQFSGPIASRLLGYILYLAVGGMVWVSFIRNGASRRSLNLHQLHTGRSELLHLPCTS